MTPERLAEIKVRAREALADVVSESDTMEAAAVQGVLIGHDVPALLAEVERLRRLLDGQRHKDITRCWECGIRFERQRSTARFCSETCKKRIQRKRKLADQAAALVTWPEKP